MKLAERTDHDLAVEFLCGTPTHENRLDADLDHWARVSLSFGRELARTPFPVTLPVISASGGVTSDHLVLAEYRARKGIVLIHEDSLRVVAERVRRWGWAEWFPPESVREAAIAHEVVHHRLHGELARELKRRLDLAALRVGRWRMRGHVVGADELVAHTYAQHVVGLVRSPLLLTTALAGG